MASSPDTSVLPSWEQLLGRLHITDTVSSFGKQETTLLQLITESREGTRPLLGKVTIALSRIKPIKCVIIVQKTSEGPVIVAATISRKRATSKLLSRSLAKPLSARSLTQRPISAKDQWLRNKYHSVCSVPFGGRHNEYQLILLTAAPVSPRLTVFLRLVTQILKLRLANLRLEEQGKRESESVASLTHHLSEGLAMTNDHLVVNLWNRPLQRFTGFSPPEAIGKPISDVFRNVNNPGWLKEKIDELAERPLNNLFRDEFEIMTKNNLRRWAEVSGSVLRDKHQKIHQIIIIVRDITEQRVLEQRKNEFISIATHELRTPITAIKGYLSLLERDRKTFTNKQQTYLQQVTAANNRLVRLAEDLLLSVQVEEDRLRLNLRPINLAAVLSKVVRDLSPKAQTKGLVLNYSSPDFVTWTIGDEDKMHQIFENLIDNAIKYTATGEIGIWFERRDLNGQPVIITNVRDTGIGVSSKNYAAIFEKFRRSHDTAQIRESGAGLGLFIVKSFVEKLGGKITVSSRMGKGTTFSVRFNASEELDGEKK